MGNKIFSKCGMRCDLCLIYRPNVEKEDRRAEICNAREKYGKVLNLILTRPFVTDVVVKKMMLYYLVRHAKQENV